MQSRHFKFLTFPAIIILFTTFTNTKNQVQATPSYFKKFASPQNSPGNTTNSRKTIELVLVTDYVYYQKIKADLPVSEKTDADVKTRIKSDIKLIYDKLKANYEQLQTSVVLLKLFIETEKDPWQDELTEKKGMLDECCWEFEKAGCENYDRSKGSACDVPAENILEVFNTWRKKQTKDNKHIGSPEARAWQQHDLAHLISGYTEWF